MRIILALLLLPAIAYADEPAPAQGNADDCARARKLNKTCELTIGAEEVEGGVDRPAGSGFSARTWAYMNSLIHIRRDFIPEIIKSAENL
jgi:hypothetical protein